MTHKLTTKKLRTWMDEMNRVRAIKEELTINLKEAAGTMVIYKDLIERYGTEFRQKASRKEIYQGGVDAIFSRMKFRALHLIVCRYLVLLKSKRSEEDVERIFIVYEFILNERNKLGRDLGITVI